MTNSRYKTCKMFMIFFFLAAILLGSIKVPYIEIRRRIIEVDESSLTVGLIEQLIKFLPEPEEMKKLAALEDQYSVLAESEQFAVVVTFS